ncbi:MAG: sigma-70 family RNA polymerase sigma factor [Gammaproteobacteria bacterium]
MPNRDSNKAATFVQGIFTTYGPLLHRYLVKRLRAGEDAQDVAQEVYLRLLRLERSDLIRQPAAYVYFIAAQIVGEQRMREAKRPLVFDSELLEHASDRGGATDLGDLADHENASRELERLMRKLSAAHRSVFLLRRRDGFSIPEIAQKLGMSVFKVKRYLVEANATIESKLRKEAL